MIIRLREEAATDLHAILSYLSERNPQGADSVHRAIQASIEAIRSQSFASERTDDLRVRAKVVRRYPYKIFYEIVGDRWIEILHIRHTARRPWAGKQG